MEKITKVTEMITKEIESYNPEEEIKALENKSLLEHYLNNPKTYRVSRDKKGRGLSSIKYNHMGVDWSDWRTLQARGIVLDDSGKVIARPYKKFFGYNQLSEKKNIESGYLSSWDEGEDFVAMDKLDGSLAIISSYRDELLICSSGSTYSPTSISIEDYIYKNFSEKALNNLSEITKTYTLMFEYIDPNSSIVIKYDEKNLILHGAIETETGKELTYEDLSHIAEKIEVDIVTVLDLKTKEEVLDYIEKTKGVEGVVIWFNNGKRLKIKTKEYVVAHSRLLSTGKLLRGKSNIIKIMDMIEDEVIDDYVALKNLDENENELFSLINEVQSIYTSFLEEEIEKAERIQKEYNVEDFKKTDIDKKFFRDEKTRDEAISVKLYNETKEEKTFIDFIIENKKTKNIIREKVIKTLGGQK